MIVLIVSLTILGVLGYVCWKRQNKKHVDALLWRLILAEYNGNISLADQLRKELQEYGVRVKEVRFLNVEDE